MIDSRYLDGLRSLNREWTQPTITYYFATGEDDFWRDKPYTWDVYDWTEVAKQGFRDALQSWANVAQLGFLEVDSHENANLRELMIDSTIGGAAGEHHPPNETGSDADDHARGRYWRDWDAYEAGPLTPGGLGFETLVHEIGHAIGLLHPHDTPTFPGVASGTDTGENGLNQTRYSVMSYNQGPLNAKPASEWGFDAGPMAFDIAAVQSLYGLNATYRKGNNIYTLPDDNSTGTGWSCIWDTGGNDWIRYNGIRDATISLVAATLDNSPTGGGVLSHADGVFGGYTIAHGVRIENAAGGSGDDDIRGNVFANLLAGGGGKDKIVGYRGDDLLEGGPGDDQVWGSGGQDLLSGSGGKDRLSGGNGNDTLGGGDGQDRLYGNAGRDRLLGDDGDDSLDGGAGRDRLFGGADDDRLSGGPGSDFFNGGDGRDAVDWTGWTGPLRVDLSKETARLIGSGTETVRNIEDVLAGPGNDRLTGDAANNRLHGGAGHDVLKGGDGRDILVGAAGNDRLIGGNGRDFLDGGPGSDTADWSTSAAQGEIDLVAGTATFPGYYVETVRNIEHLVLGSARDVVIGSSADNRIVGNGGNDSIDGKAGADALYGGAGLDYLVGDVGNDFLSGGDDDDWLTAGDGADRLNGGAGNDNIDGGAGQDRLTGNGGTDNFVFNDGCGRDRIFDFENDVDVLRINDNLWGGGLTRQQVVQTYATVVDNAVVFDFGGGDEITLAAFGLIGTNELVDDILII